MATPKDSPRLDISTSPSKATAMASVAQDGGGGSRGRRAKLSPVPGSVAVVVSVGPARARALPASQNFLQYCRARTRRGIMDRLLESAWLSPLVLMFVIVSLFAANPTESNVAYHFLFLSYRIEGQDGRSQYGKGPWDLAFVCFYTIFLFFTREFVMSEMLRPLAALGGIKSCAKKARFAEQMYTVCYITFIGPLGLYTMKETPGLWYFETRGMYETYPHTTHDAVFKFYYLFQAAFWVQQAIVMLLGLERPRKDFRELIAHHIITISLIFFSYRFHFTYIGIAVYVTHDLSDYFLAVSSLFSLLYVIKVCSNEFLQISKSLNYLDHPAQSYSFALCIAAWIYLRHYINLDILRSIVTEYSTIGPFGLDWEAEQFKCRFAQIGTFCLLAALQGLNVFWLYCLFRSAYRFVVMGVAKDDRSEAEESEVEEVVHKQKKVVVVEGGAVEAEMEK